MWNTAKHACNPYTHTLILYHKEEPDAIPNLWNKKPPLPGGRDGLQSYKSDRMRLVLVVSMQSIDTLQAGIALFEELGGDLREHSVG